MFEQLLEYLGQTHPLTVAERIIIFAVFGALIGWLLGKARRADAQRRRLRDRQERVRAQIERLSRRRKKRRNDDSKLWANIKANHGTIRDLLERVQHLEQYRGRVLETQDAQVFIREHLEKHDGQLRTIYRQIEAFLDAQEEAATNGHAPVYVRKGGGHGGGSELDTLAAMLDAQAKVLRHTMPNVFGARNEDDEEKDT